jgi:hypothetical protein
VTSREVKGDEPARRGLLSIELECFACDEMNRNGIGAERVEHEQIVRA